MYRLALVAAFCLPALANADDYQSRGVQLEVTADGHANVIAARQNVLLFVRERKTDARGETMPYLFLGAAVCSRA